MGDSKLAPPTRLRRRSIPQKLELRPSARIPAWLVSVCLHVLLLTTLAVLWRSRSMGTGAEEGTPVGIAVVHRASDGQEQYYLSDAESSTTVSSGGAQSEQVSENTDASQLPANLPGEAAGESFNEELLSDLLPGDDGLGDDVLEAAGSLELGEGGAAVGGERSAPKAKTQLFGIEGEGSRFLYVFDRSASMDGFQGKPYRFAKAELLDSLQSLGAVHQFQIIFYNDSPLPYGGFSNSQGLSAPRLLNGDEQSKREAKRFVEGVPADGGTQHIDALRMAMNMNPDVIFFLTDGDRPALSNKEIENLHTRAARLGATIHSIQFGAGPNQNDGGWIRQLANGTQGKYRYIDVSKL